jgi:hypothetical protein
MLSVFQYGSPTNCDTSVKCSVAVTIKNAQCRFTLWQDVPLLPRMDASQTATRVLAKEHSNDAHLAQSVRASS